MICVSLNGSRLSFSITFSKLRQLKYSYEKLYCDFFDYYTISDKNITDKAVLVYIAYLCANLDNLQVMSEGDFYSLLEDNISQIETIFDKIYYSKINCDFAKTFKKRTKKYNNKIDIPKFKLCDLEDYYCYYVLLNKIPENTFWNCDIAFLEGITMDKNAFDGFMNYQEHKLLNRK